MMKRVARIWKYSLGSFSDDKTKPYDNYVAGVRSIIALSYLVTNCFIISGVIRHWNDNEQPQTRPLISSGSLDHPLLCQTSTLGDQWDAL
jgi:ATP/ADP translocase